MTGDDKSRKKNKGGKRIRDVYLRIQERALLPTHWSSA
jgi:hypothetical protein